jgi:peptide/nickel transport system substrate-binding protein
MLGRLTCTCVAALLMAGVLAVLPSQIEAKTFRFAHANDIDSMDPFGLANPEAIYFMSNVYEALTRFNAQGAIEPALAEAWEVVEPSTWRFRLREGVRFHDGQPFDADDVLFSFERAKAQGSSLGYAVRSIRAVRKVDAHTVDIELVTPNSVIDRELTFWFMMSRAWAEQHNALLPADIRQGQENHATRHANGTGPFQLRSREPGVRIVLEANPDWWDEPTHNLTDVVYTPIASGATRVAALLSGEVDLIDPVPLQDVARIRAAQGVHALTGDSLRTVFIGVNLQGGELADSDVAGKNPLADLRVRQAIHQAINIDAIRSRVMEGFATPTALPIGPMIFGYDAALNRRLPYDPDAARALLVEAGYADGFRLGLDCPSGVFTKDEELCQVLVPMLARIGIDLQVRSMVPSRYYEAIMGVGQVSGLYLHGWTGSQTMDASSITANVLHSRTETLGTYNGAGYVNPRIDAILRESLAATDAEVRQALFSEMLGIVTTELPLIPLHHLNLAWGVRDGVAIPQGADNRVRLWMVQVQ